MEKAVGLIRVSDRGDRAGESFSGPRDQRDAIERACDDRKLKLVRSLGEGGIFSEINVSGGKPLEQRTKGLLPALRAVEQGRANVIVVAYFDRLFRSLRVQTEVLERAEAAKGRVLALDVGDVVGEDQWLSATMHGLIAEQQRRQAKTKTLPAQLRAMNRGALSITTPLGYTRTDDKVLIIDERSAKVVQEAFETRAAGMSIEQVRQLLASRGYKRSSSGVRKMLLSRAYRGEFETAVGHYEDDKLAIVSEDLHRRANRTVLPRGPKPKSTRLLARLGVLRCASCGARMTVGTGNGRYRVYRCPTTSVFSGRSAVSAPKLEALVVDVGLLAVGSLRAQGVVGGSSVEAAEAARAQLQRRYDDWGAAAADWLAWRPSRSRARAWLRRVSPASPQP